MAYLDHSLLDVQPKTTCDATPENIGSIVVSAIINTAGNKVVISRYADDVWEMYPFFEQSNRSASEKRIDWLKQPAPFREQIKAILYRYWMVGREGFQRPTAGTVRDASVRVAVFLRYLLNLNVNRLVDISPTHVFNFIQYLQNTKNNQPKAINNSLQCIELLYLFRTEHSDSMLIPPLGESNPYQSSGLSSTFTSQTRRVSGTDVIPKNILTTLFAYSENILNTANLLLDQRDCSSNIVDVMPLNHYLIVRDSCFFLLGLLSGMRCDEILGVEIGASRTENINGFTYNWIKSIEHKTKKGNVEYLVSTMALKVLVVMERWSHPYRIRLQEQIDLLLLNGESALNVEQLKRLHELVSNKDRLFLSSNGDSVVSGRSWGKPLKQLTDAAGVEWDLAPHQLRRTYARMFVEHRLGNLLLLKEQFKHSSLDMTQLYAANDMQDETLYDECLTELYEYKNEVVLGWLSKDKPLSGGSGLKIMQMRANAFPDRASMIRDTSEKVTIRSTGHSWCLSQFSSGCGGQGLYERTRCTSCGHSVIDDTFQNTWHEIYLHQLELENLSKELGPGAQQRVNRDITRARKVLSDLGVNNLPADLQLSNI